MTDRTTTIRRLVLDTRTATDVDTVAEQHVTRALAHESRRRNRPHSKRMKDAENPPRGTR